MTNATLVDEGVRLVGRALDAAEGAKSLRAARDAVAVARKALSHASTAISAERLARVDRQPEPVLDAEAARIFSRLGVSVEDVAKAEAHEAHRAAHQTAQITEAEEAMRRRLGLTAEEWAAANQEGSR